MPVNIVIPLICWVIVGLPTAAAAYIGPGAGLSVIGTVFAFVSAVAFMLVGFVWYPVKRLLAAIRNRGGNGDKAPAA